MKKLLPLLLVIMCFIGLSGAGLSSYASAETAYKKLVYDDAKLLTEEEYSEINALANEYSIKRETDIIIITTSNAENKDVVDITEDFYDENGPGYDKQHGNAVLLTLDMYNRDVYLAGFYKAETYLDDDRLDKIREKITPYLSEGDYYSAFSKYIKTSYKYMGFKPGVNPDNILFQLWFQVLIAVAIGGVTVWIMAANSGGRVTVNKNTYIDPKNSGVLDRGDRYIRTTITKTKIERSSGGGGGGGGGGGISGGGHSHSGSRGSF